MGKYGPFTGNYQPTAVHRDNAKIVTEGKIGEYNVIEFDRTDLSAEMEKYWVGKSSSNIGMQYVTFGEDGLVHSREGIWERKDILMVQFGAVDKDDKALGWKHFVNVFVYVDGGCSVEPCGMELTDSERRHVIDVASEELKKKKDFVDRQRRFFAEKPWLKVDGMRPKEAVAKLRELGW